MDSYIVTGNFTIADQRVVADQLAQPWVNARVIPTLRKEPLVAPVTSGKKLFAVSAPSSKNAFAGSMSTAYLSAPVWHQAW